MSEQHDRPVVDGTDPGGPIAPGQSAGAGSAAAADPSVSPNAEPGASYADADAGRMAGEDALKAPNQARTEPIPPSGAGDVPSGTGELPEPAGARPDEEAGTSTGPGPRQGWATAPPSSAPSGDVQGVPVPGATPAEGTSEGMAPIEGVTFPAVAPEGLADGETDVAMPSTTHF